MGVGVMKISVVQLKKNPGLFSSSVEPLSVWWLGHNLQDRLYLDVFVAVLSSTLIQILEHSFSLFLLFLRLRLEEACNSG